MKNLIIYLILTIFFQSSYAQNSFENKKILDSNDELKIENDAKKMVEYFRRLHYPYENMTADQVQSVKEEVNRIANESIFRRIDGNDFLSATSDWQFVGPYGMRSPGSPYTIYSGRVLAIETSSGEMRVLSASGNL